MRRVLAPALAVMVAGLGGFLAGVIASIGAWVAGIVAQAVQESF